MKISRGWSGGKLDLRLDIVDGVRRPGLQSDCLAGELLSKDLRTTTGTKDRSGGSLLLDSETVQPSWSCSPAKNTFLVGEKARYFP